MVNGLRIKGVFWDLEISIFARFLAQKMVDLSECLVGAITEGPVLRLLAVAQVEIAWKSKFGHIQSRGFSVFLPVFSTWNLTGRCLIL
jgi:hypothetical protein